MVSRLMILNNQQMVLIINVITKEQEVFLGVVEYTDDLVLKRNYIAKLNDSLDKEHTSSSSKLPNIQKVYNPTDIFQRFDKPIKAKLTNKWYSI